MWPLYVGGFMGPFGGAMVNAMLPELAASLGTSVGTAATAVTWYMIPFSTLMLVSGTVGARFGLARAIRVAFITYAVASAICVVATAPVPFLGGRMLQGAANAFTTPLLLALIAELVPPQRLGRALGTYAACGAAGQAFAPFVGGVAAGVDYRWAFGLSAVAAVTLAAITPAGRAAFSSSDARGAASAPGASGASGAASSVHAAGASSASGAGSRPSVPGPRWRELLNPRLALACLTGFAGQFTATAVMLVAALTASDRFELEPAARGVVVATFGMAGFVSGRSIGKLADRVGTTRTGIRALLLLGAAALALPLAPWVVALVAAVALAGVGATSTRVLTNTLSMQSTPSNPAGATSVALAVSFVGSALTPFLLPLYHWRPETVGVIPLVLCFVAVAMVHFRGDSGSSAMPSVRSDAPSA